MRQLGSFWAAHLRDSLLFLSFFISFFISETSPKHLLWHLLALSFGSSGSRKLSKAGVPHAALSAEPAELPKEHKKTSREEREERVPPFWAFLGSRIWSRSQALAVAWVLRGKVGPACGAQRKTLRQKHLFLPLFTYNFHSLSHACDWRKQKKRSWNAAVARIPPFHHQQRVGARRGQKIRGHRRLADLCV